MKFATLINFTEQGLKNIEDSPKRAAAFREQAEGKGIRITELLWLAGRFDGLMVFEASDPQSASTAMLQLGKSGNVKTEMLQAFDTTDIQKVVEGL